MASLPLDRYWVNVVSDPRRWFQHNLVSGEGAREWTQPASGTIVLNAIGTITYVPRKGFSGTEKFTCKSSDGSAQSNAATVTITAK